MNGDVFTVIAIPMDGAAYLYNLGEKALLDDLSNPFRQHVSLEDEDRVALFLAGNSLGFTPASEFSADTHIPTGVQSIDNALGGGLPCLPGGHMVEVHGAAGSGKTQFCLTACAASTGAIYLVTSKQFPGKRFEQLSNSAALDTTIVEHVRNVARLERWAAHRLPWLLRESGAKLVVIDSIAALYRPTFPRGEELARARSMRYLVHALKKATAEIGGVVLAVNEVSARPDMFVNATVPALGAAWGSCCNTRLELSRVRGGVRRMRVLRSSIASSGAVGYFTIGENGLESADDM